MDKPFIHASNGRGYDKFSGKNYKYVLSDREWNDFGYYTLHELFLITPDGTDNIKLADIRLLNFNQKFNEHVNLNITNFIGFISNVESAERLLLFLSPSERKELFSTLHINFTVGMFSSQPAFLKSVLRDITFEQFEERQSRIKTIVSFSEDVSSLIKRNKEILKLL